MTDNFPHLVFGHVGEDIRIENVPAGASVTVTMRHDEFVTANVVIGDREEVWFLAKREDGKFELRWLSGVKVRAGRPSFLILAVAEILYPFYVISAPLRWVFNFLRGDYRANRAMLDRYQMHSNQ